MSDLNYYLLSADSDKQPRLRQQHKDAVNNGVIVCGCGLRRALLVAFKCVYCGEWFCFPCAEKHFGQTVNEWREEKRIKLRMELNELSFDQVKERIRNRALAETEGK